MRLHSLILTLKIVLFVAMIFVPFLGGSETVGIYNYLFIFALQCMYFYPTTPLVVSILLLVIIDIVLSSIRKCYYLTYLWVLLFNCMIIYGQFFVSNYIYNSLLTSLHIIIFLLQIFVVFLLQKYKFIKSEK